MTQTLVSLNLMLGALLVAIAAGQLDGILTTDAAKGAVTAVIAIVLAGIGPLLPKVSETLRRTLDLQRRG